MITLRDAQLTDATAIATLHAESWQRTYRGIYTDTFLDHEVEEDRYAVWIERLTTPTQNQQVMVALMNNAIAGFACFYLDEDPVFGSLLDNLHIAFDWQRSGIGKQLLQEGARRICKCSNNRQLYLWVYESNLNARRVYERLGAVHYETVTQPTASGKEALACRYVWPDVGVLL